MPQKSGDGRGESQRRESQPPSEPAGDGQRTDARTRERGGDGLTQWFASTAVQAGLTVIGVVLLIFAVGQAVGVPLLEFTVDAVSSETGRWLVVAFIAIMLIGAAQRIGTTA